MEAPITVFAQHEKGTLRFWLVARLAYSTPVALPVIGGDHLGCFLGEAQAERVSARLALRAGYKLRGRAATALEQCLGAYAAQGLRGQARPHLSQPLVRYFPCFRRLLGRGTRRCYRLSEHCTITIGNGAASQNSRDRGISLDDGDSGARDGRLARLAPRHNVGWLHLALIRARLLRARAPELSPSLWHGVFCCSCASL